MNLWIEALGTPIPQGSKAAKVVGKRAVMWEANPKHKAWRETVRLAAWKAAQGMEFTGPVRVTMYFYMPRPKTVKRLWPAVKPDGSKLQRSVEDSLVDAGVIADDALIVQWSGIKRYEDDMSKAGVRVLIESIHE